MHWLSTSGNDPRGQRRCGLRSKGLVQGVGLPSVRAPLAAPGVLAGWVEKHPIRCLPGAWRGRKAASILSGAPRSGAAPHSRLDFAWSSVGCQLGSRPDFQCLPDRRLASASSQPLWCRDLALRHLPGGAGPTPFSAAAAMPSTSCATAGPLQASCGALPFERRHTWPGLLFPLRLPARVNPNPANAAFTRQVHGCPACGPA